MFKHQFDQNADIKVVFGWFLLSFNGGAINAGGFLATGKFVSHVTGFATLFGVDAARLNFQTAFALLSVPLFFMFGAFLAGLLVERPLLQGKVPHFNWVMGLSTFCLVSVSLQGELLHFGNFGDPSELRQSYLLLALLCLACGLQNGAITSSSGRSIRTTHLTGLVTDFGLGLSRILASDLPTQKRSAEVRGNYLRAGSISAFVLGSMVGAWFFVQFGFKGFLLPALISGYAAWEGHKTKFKIGS